MFATQTSKNPAKVSVAGRGRGRGRTDQRRRGCARSPLATGEDHELWNTIRSGGYPVTADPSLVVTTSSRLVARAPDGFAADLGALTDASGRTPPHGPTATTRRRAWPQSEARCVGRWFR